MNNKFIELKKYLKIIWNKILMKKLYMVKSSITKDFYQAQDNAYEYAIINALIYTKTIIIR